jgi:hypothetical protein
VSEEGKGGGFRVIKISKCSHEFSLARVLFSCLGLAASIDHTDKGIGYEEDHTSFCSVVST